MKTLIGLLVLCAVLGGGVVLAHGPGQHVLGTVTAADVGRLEIKTTKGNTISVEVTDETRYRGKGLPAGASPQVGDRVVVDIRKTGDTLTATEVQFASGKSGAGQ